MSYESSTHRIYWLFDPVHLKELKMIGRVRMLTNLNTYINTISSLYLDPAAHDAESFDHDTYNLIIEHISHYQTLINTSQVSDNDKNMDIKPLSVPYEIQLHTFWLLTTFTGTLFQKCNERHQLNDHIIITAVQLYKRVYLFHSTIDFDPLTTIITCVFLALKLSNQYIPPDRLLPVQTPLGQIPSKSPNITTEIKEYEASIIEHERQIIPLLNSQLDIYTGLDILQHLYRQFTSHTVLHIIDDIYPYNIPQTPGQIALQNGLLSFSSKFNFLPRDTTSALDPSDPCIGPEPQPSLVSHPYLEPLTPYLTDTLVNIYTIIVRNIKLLHLTDCIFISTPHQIVLGSMVYTLARYIYYIEAVLGRTIVQITNNDALSSPLSSLSPSSSSSSLSSSLSSSSSPSLPSPSSSLPSIPSIVASRPFDRIYITSLLKQLTHASQQTSSPLYDLYNLDSHAASSTLYEFSLPNRTFMPTTTELRNRSQLPPAEYRNTGPQTPLLWPNDKMFISAASTVEDALLSIKRAELRAMTMSESSHINNTSELVIPSDIEQQHQQQQQEEEKEEVTTTIEDGYSTPPATLPPLFGFDKNDKRDITSSSSSTTSEQHNSSNNSQIVPRQHKQNTHTPSQNKQQQQQQPPVERVINHCVPSSHASLEILGQMCISFLASFLSAYQLNSISDNNTPNIIMPYIFDTLINSENDIEWYRSLSTQTQQQTQQQQQQQPTSSQLPQQPSNDITSLDNVDSVKTTVQSPNNTNTTIDSVPLHHLRCIIAHSDMLFKFQQVTLYHMLSIEFKERQEKKVERDNLLAQLRDDADKRLLSGASNSTPTNSSATTAAAALAALAHPHEVRPHKNIDKTIYAPSSETQEKIISYYRKYTTLQSDEERLKLRRNAIQLRGFTLQYSSSSSNESSDDDSNDNTTINSDKSIKKEKKDKKIVKEKKDMKIIKEKKDKRDNIVDNIDILPSDIHESKPKRVKIIDDDDDDDNNNADGNTSRSTSIPIAKKESSDESTITTLDTNTNIDETLTPNTFVSLKKGGGYQVDSDDEELPIAVGSAQQPTKNDMNDSPQHDDDDDISRIQRKLFDNDDNEDEPVLSFNPRVDQLDDVKRKLFEDDE